MSIGERIREALTLRELSIRALHKALQENDLPGTSYPALHRYLKGEVDPPAAFVSAVAQVLRARPEWLLLGIGPALQEEWDLEQERERQAYAAWVVQGLRDSPGGDGEVIDGMELGAGGVAEHRRAALRRFSRKLFDVGVLGGHSWSDFEDRHTLLKAAGHFLVAVDAAFEGAGTLREKGQFTTWRTDLLLARSSSPGWRVTWTDDVLNLFARRVLGLGERDRFDMRDAHAPAAPRERIDSLIDARIARSHARAAMPNSLRPLPPDE